MKHILFVMLFFSISCLGCGNSDELDGSVFAEYDQHLVSENGKIINLYFPEKNKDSHLVAVNLDITKKLGLELRFYEAQKYSGYERAQIALKPSLIKTVNLRVFYEQASEPGIVSLCGVKELSYKLENMLKTLKPIQK